jgi:uncharacterized protein YkwD
MKFFSHAPKNVDRKDFKVAKNTIEEIEEWELEYSEKDFSISKNNSILVGYLAYKFGEIVGLNEDELSDVYIAALVQNIGKVYMCGEEKELAYEYSTSPLKAGEEGFEEISEALKQVPLKTKEYLEKNTEFESNIIDTASNFRSVYSNLFKEGYPNSKKEISQLDTVLWFADSLTALSFSSIEKLEQNYKKGSYVYLWEAFEILKEQTEEKVPQFWGKASSASLMGLVFTMMIGMSSPSEIEAANYSSQQIVDSTNRERLNRGLESLKVDSKLMNAAMNRARDMFEKQYWSHYGPNGETAWQFIYGQGYGYLYAGENLAKGFVDVQSINQSWMSSPLHSANILKPEYNETGVAVMDGVLEGKEVTLVVQILTKKKEATPPPVVKEKAVVKPKPVAKAKPSVTTPPKEEEPVVITPPEEIIEEEVEEIKQEVEKDIEPKEEQVTPLQEEHISTQGDEAALLSSFEDFLRRVKEDIKDQED